MIYYMGTIALFKQFIIIKEKQDDNSPANIDLSVLPNYVIFFAKIHIRYTDT